MVYLIIRQVGTHIYTAAQSMAIRVETTMGLFSDNFAGVFRDLVEKSGVTRYRIAQYSHVDEAYLCRLMEGEKTNPSPEIVVRISLSLAHLSDKITIYDIDRLFKAIGHPLLRER